MAARADTATGCRRFALLTRRSHLPPSGPLPGRSRPLSGRSRPLSRPSRLATVDRIPAASPSDAAEALCARPFLTIHAQLEWPAAGTSGHEVAPPGKQSKASAPRRSNDEAKSTSSSGLALARAPGRSSPPSPNWNDAQPGPAETRWLLLVSRAKRRHPDAQRRGEVDVTERPRVGPGARPLLTTKPELEWPAAGTSGNKVAPPGKQSKASAPRRSNDEAKSKSPSSLALARPARPLLRIDART